MIGTQDERLQALAVAGLDQAMILPSFDTRFDLLERVVWDVLPHV